jgi:methylmalonyl-CoA mutase N-terminal domain/subunit
MALKKSNTFEKVRKALVRLRKSAERNDNLVPTILEAVKSYGAVGEICDVLRDIFGEYHQSLPSF